MNPVVENGIAINLRVIELFYTHMFFTEKIRLLIKINLRMAKQIMPFFTTG